MHAASARHNDQERVRRRGARVNETARQSRRWRNMQNNQAAQHYSNKHFKVHLRSLDAVSRAEVQQPNRGQTRDLSRWTELLKNNLC